MSLSVHVHFLPKGLCREGNVVERFSLGVAADVDAFIYDFKNGQTCIAGSLPALKVMKMAFKRRETTFTGQWVSLLRQLRLRVSIYCSISVL